MHNDLKTLEKGFHVNSKTLNNPTALFNYFMDAMDEYIEDKLFDFSFVPESYQNSIYFSLLKYDFINPFSILFKTERYYDKKTLLWKNFDKYHCFDFSRKGSGTISTEISLSKLYKNQEGLLCKRCAILSSTRERAK